jgi:hypothetical protein
MILFSEYIKISFFDERTERSEEFPHVHKFLIKLLSHNYKILNV